MDIQGLQHYPNNRPWGRFGVGKLPRDVFVAQNAVLNREVVDLAGYTPGVLIPARNNYERLERAGDVVVWLLIGFGLPWLIGNRFFKQKATQRLIRDFQLHNTQPLGTSWEQLDKAALQAPEQKQALANRLGLPNVQQLPKLREAILKTKLNLMLIDQLLIISANLLWAFGKVKLTEKLSGKKGFVGEFDYTSDAYRTEKNKTAQTQQPWRFVASLLIGYGSALALPAIMRSLLNSKVPHTSWKQASNAVGKLKSLVPLFNYTNVIFMSKACLVWPAIFGWEASNLLASRDSHEVRERLIMSGFLNFSYFFADELFSGLLAKGVTRWQGAKLPKGALLQKGPWGLPLLKPLPQLYETYGKGPILNSARWCYWPGLLGAAALTGFGITILNNTLTHQKVTQDLQAQKPSPPLSTHPPRLPMATPLSWNPALSPIGIFPSQNLGTWGGFG